MAEVIKVQKVSWGSVRDELQETFSGDEPEIKADVDAGIAHCWRIGNTALISRKDGGELVVMCLAGRDLAQSAPVIKAAATKAGCDRIRLHTKRPALQRLLKPFGVEIDEYILRVTL